MSVDPLFLTTASNILTQVITQAIAYRWKRLDKEKVEGIIKDYLKEHGLVGQASAIRTEIFIVLADQGVIGPGGQLRLSSSHDPALPEKLRQSVWDRIYKIVSVCSEKALDVPKDNTDNGMLIQQWDYWGGKNQQWKLIPVSGHDELFKIHSQHSAKVLDVPINQLANV